MSIISGTVGNDEWKFCIDATSGTLIFHEHTAHVRGWVVLPSDAYSFDVFWNNIRLDTIHANTKREDVQAAFPDVKNTLYSGFTTKIDVSLIPESERNGAELYFALRKSGKILGDLTFPLCEEEASLELCIDNAQFDDAGVMQAGSSNFHLAGWAIVQQTAITALSVSFGNDLVVPAQYGIPRTDVFAIRSDNPNGLNTGFSLFVPKLNEGKTSLTFIIELKNGKILNRPFSFEVTPSPADNTNLGELGYGERQFWNLLSQRTNDKRVDLPLWVVVVRPSSKNWIQSKSAQSTFDSLAYNKDQNVRMITLIDRKAEETLLGLGDYGPFFESDAHLAVLLGDIYRNHEKDFFITFLEVGETISRAAPSVAATYMHPDTHFIYWDEQSVLLHRQVLRKTPGGPFVSALHSNFYGRGWAARIGHADLKEISAWGCDDFISSQPLKCFYYAPAHSVHIAEVLSSHQYDRDLKNLTHSEIDARQRLLNGLETRYGKPSLAVIEDHTPEGATHVRLDVALPTSPPLVSVIMPTIAKLGRVFTLLEHLRKRSTYKNLEIIVLDHIQYTVGAIENKKKLRDMADIVIPVSGAFNWSKFNNMGAAVANGDILFFMNDDLEVISPDWIEQLLAYLNLKHVGTVGPRLLLPDERIVQSCGVSLLPEAGWARNDFAFSAADSFMADGLNNIPRNATSLLGAVIAVSRDLFLSMDGFEEALPLTFNDLDFHMRIRDLEQQVVVVPQAELIHYEKTSRAELVESPMEALYWERWNTHHAKGDPYWHPSTEWTTGFYKTDCEPVETVWCDGIFGARKDVQRILILRLDHVGDFVQTLSAFGQLRETFPQAHIEIVVGKWNHSLASETGLFDKVHVFNLYAARSGDGRALDQDAAIQQFTDLVGGSLYDLVIDMRADGDTRFLLLHVAATVKAGFSFNVSFPWLDIAVETPGNIPRFQKKANGAIEMQRMISAVALAYPVIEPRARTLWEKSQTTFPMPKKHGVRVVIHPFSGNEIKFWPAHHWVSLVTLMRQAGLSVELIGTPAEKQAKPDMVEDLVTAGAIDRIGQFTLTQLVHFIEESDCFVGADSGPKHIAASTGVPTVAIQSGFVDPVVWSPFNVLGLSVIKRVSCAPCYLDDVALCKRNHDCMKKIYPRHVFHYIDLLTNDAKNKKYNSSTSMMA